jgi:hypothetical protein
MPWIVTGARYLRDYVVEITFADGLVRATDLAPFLEGPIYQPLKSIDFFKRMQVDPEGGTIVWPNGADIAPETLYYNLGPTPYCES